MLAKPAAGLRLGIRRSPFAERSPLGQPCPYRIDQTRVRCWPGRMLLAPDQFGDRDRIQGSLGDARNLSDSTETHGLIELIDA